jgi:hypothetical protein
MTMMYVAITESEELSAARLDSPPMQHVPAAMLLLLQQGLGATGFSSPPGGDTVGYWQQRVAYTIVATLDEREQKVRAQGRLRYVNSSPDTLREMFLHQYLNAFRPGSDWSAADERAGVERFQRLEEPHFGYERFTSPVRVNGTAVVVEYTGAPDSTVARFALPRPLRPGDSVDVAFDWEARPSTVARRQGRRGRHWDLAQWYPKVAVYDRGGWQHNSLKPAGEFYGEFGTYDVTLVVAEAQVIGATGVPVSGDPGWQRARRAGVVRDAANAYDAIPPPPPADVPSGFKAVRFFARDVHHFAWSASPDYRYEGGEYVRRNPDTRFRTWDTVAIHALYRAGDDTTWGGQRVVNRTINALRWLEAIFGPYAYPQMTVLHRIDGGGTEFPMMQMNGSPSQGLILHEGGHVWTYGILANNEWRSGWMDEGFTSYQTEWAQGLTPQERVRAGVVDRFVEPVGYRARAITMAIPRFDAIGLQRTLTDFEGRAQPIGTVAHRFRDFGTYNDMIYNRAQVMYGQLRDALGDSLFAAFMHDYYARWALRHVDERAMRASAERVSGRNLAWFFDQWVHRTGVIDYSLRRVRTTRDASGAWITDATVQRKGDYAHPMNVGVRTASGWTIGRMTKEPYDEEVVRITTAQEPIDVRLDPYHVTFDWDRRNDRHWGIWSAGAVKYVFDWPFLDQTDRDRRVLRYRPTFWYSDPGGAAIGVSERGNYLGFAHNSALDATVMTRAGRRSMVQLYGFMSTGKNPDWRSGLGRLDDVYHWEVGRRSEFVAGVRERAIDVAFTAALPGMDASELLPELWVDDLASVDLALRGRWHIGSVDDSYWFIRPSILGGYSGDEDATGFGKLELALGRVTNVSEDMRVALRAYGGGTVGAPPPQRALYLSAADPVASFRNHWWRPNGAILKRPNVNYLPLGGPALRAYHWALSSKWAAGGNAEVARRLFDVGARADTAGVWLTLFGDAAATEDDSFLNDAGFGVAVRGKLYDRPINLRLDFPIWASDATRTLDRGHAGREKVAPRWTITFNDLW